MGSPVLADAAASVPLSWWALAAAVVTTATVGLLVRTREGRIRRNTGSAPGVGSAVVSSSAEQTWGDQLPDALRRHLVDEHAVASPDSRTRVTLLQLSSTFCAPCRHTRILLSGLAERTDGLRHVEVDLTHHPQWSTPLGVHRTPTTIALDAAGRELFRVGGVPRRDELATALHPHLDA